MKLISKIIPAMITLAFSIQALATEKSHPNDSAVPYQALNAKGKPLKAKANLARCMKDNKSNLVWELKTDDGGIHDKDNTYRWGGKGAEQTATVFFDDWNNLVDATNAEKLCGFTDWRVPTIDELKSLVVANNGEPTIDKDYFPLTLANAYWSTSTYANYPEHAQTVHFGTGVSYYYNGYRGNSLAVRLVRSPR